MNNTTLSRRSWLKQTTLLAGGLPLAGSLFSNWAFAASGTNNIHNFISDAKLAQYLPPVLKARLWANENPFGPSPKAKEAMINSLDTSYQYPFQYSKELAKKIAAFENLTPDNILLSSGSTPLIQATAIYISKPGANIVSGETTYEDLPTRATALGTKWIKVPLTKEYSLDLETMEKAITPNTSLVYICNPNNPTGTIVDADKLRDFCERVSERTLIFIDEAYLDYLDNSESLSLMSAVRKNQNVIIAKTFSKLYGMAGLRVGYIAAKKELIDTITKYTEGDFSLSAPSVKAALAAYKDSEFLNMALAKTIESKKYLYETLNGLGYNYVPSHTNFVMFPIKMDGPVFADEMLKRGIALRHWKMVGKNWCRISIGKMEEMQAFAEAFKTIA